MNQTEYKYLCSKCRLPCETDLISRERSAFRRSRCCNSRPILMDPPKKET